MKNYLPFVHWLPKAKSSWKEDLIAGATITVIAIPQAVAFAIIAGLPPIYGLYTAIIIPIVTAIFGSSKHLISGPTTSISILLFASLSKILGADASVLEPELYIAMALSLSFFAGLIQFLMGVFKWANIVNFVSHTVVVGFTAGAGILIAFKQFDFIFGIAVPKGSRLLEILSYLIKEFAQVNWYVFSVAMFTLMSAIVLKKIKYTSKFSMLLAMVLGSLLAMVLGMEKVGISTVGAIEFGIPKFAFPIFDFDVLSKIASSALIMALLGTVEAVAIAKSVALKTHQKINLNQEFVGQGLANMISSLFSGFAGSGSFSRTGVNVQAGSKTPLSSLFNAFFIVILLLFGSKILANLPNATLGGVILLVGYNLIDFKHIKRIFNSSYKEAVVFIVTFLSILIFNLEYALLFGVVVSLLFYLYKTSNVHISKLAMSTKSKFINIARETAHKKCPQLHILRIDGSIYFGTIEKLSSYFNELFLDENKYVILVAHSINFIDLSGAEWLSYEMNRFTKAGGKIVVVGAKLKSQEILRKGGFFESIGEYNFFDENKDAISYMYSFLDKVKCTNCKVLAFKECKVS